MSSYQNIFSGGILQPSFSFYAAYTLSSNLSLSWNTDFGPNPNVVAAIMDVSPTGPGFNLILPNAMNISVGFSFSINNITGFSFNLVANDGSTIIDTIGGPSFNTFYLTNNSTQNGTWRDAPYGIGSGAVTSVAISTSGTSGNLITGGSPITLAGTISLSLGADLAGLTTLAAATGIAVRTAAAGTWHTTAITGTANQVAVTNGNGVAGSPTIALVPALSNLSSISLNSGGNLNLGVVANTISANNSGGSLNLSANSIGGSVIVAAPAGGIQLNASTAVGITSNALTLLTSGASLVFTGTASNVFINASLTTNSYSVTLPTGPGAVNQVLQITSVAAPNIMRTSWVSAGSGTVTAITAGTNLTGGTITTTGTIALASALAGLTSVSTNTLITSPVASGAAGLVLGVPYQNSLGYDVTLHVYFDITSNTSGVISCGVGPTNTPPQQVILTGSTTVGYLPVTVYLPNNYYALISTTGTLTIAIRGQQVTPV